MKRSRLKKKFNRFKSNENWEELRKQRNLYSKIKRKAKISHFRNLSKNPSANEFWKTVKPFRYGQRALPTEDYMLEENDDLIVVKIWGFWDTSTLHFCTLHFAI